MIRRGQYESEGLVRMLLLDIRKKLKDGLNRSVVVGWKEGDSFKKYIGDKTNRN